MTYATHCDKISLLAFIHQIRHFWNKNFSTLWGIYQHSIWKIIWIFARQKLRVKSIGQFWRENSNAALMCDASANQVAATATDDHRDWRIFQLWFHCASVQSAKPQKCEKQAQKYFWELFREKWKSSLENCFFLFSRFSKLYNADHRVGWT